MTAYTGIAEIDAFLAGASETTNQHGNRVRHVFHSTERYLFDFNLDLSQWAQFDTESDAWYFGCWTNKSERRVLSYVEGDIYLVECEDDESYDREVAALCEFHKPSPEFIVLDEKGRTDYYQDRSQHFIDPVRYPGGGPADGEDPA